MSTTRDPQTRHERPTPRHERQTLAMNTISTLPEPDLEPLMTGPTSGAPEARSPQNAPSSTSLLGGKA